MSAEDFFSRWAKKNQEAQADRTPEPVAPEPAQSPDPYEGRTPTQDDLDKLSPQDDLSVFMKRGVDENVKRSALKKLFSDPHFNIMDGLDIYIDDYSKPDPIPPEMMAMLEHAKGLLNPEGLKEQPVMSMRSQADVARGQEVVDESVPAAADPAAADAAEPSTDAQSALSPPQPGPDQHTPAKEEQLLHPADQPAASSAATHDTSGTHPEERETPKP